MLSSMSVINDFSLYLLMVDLKFIDYMNACTCVCILQCVGGLGAYR